MAWPLRGGVKGLASKKKKLILKLYLSYFKTKIKFLLPLSSMGVGEALAAMSLKKNCGFPNILENKGHNLGAVDKMCIL